MKTEWLRYCGNMQQLAYVRKLQYGEGRSEHMNAYEVKCGDLLFHVSADKCLDVTDLAYKGENMTFLSKPGLQGRNPYDTHGAEAQRSIMGGLFFTCGLENFCAPCTVDGKEYPMHGRMRTTPAELVGADAYFDGDDYVITISGEMREAELFGENMVLRRKIETKLGSNSIVVTDEIENQSFRTEPLMMLYHCNMGYPFLDENCKIYLPTKKVVGREEFSEQHKDMWNQMEAPVDNEQEYVYIHHMAADENGDTVALVVNEAQNLAMSIEFNQKNLPYFMEWKSIASGDYVIGLEPANGPVYGKVYAIENGEQHTIAPFEKETNRLIFTVLEGEEAIQNVIKRINGLIK